MCAESQQDNVMHNGQYYGIPRSAFSPLMGCLHLYPAWRRQYTPRLPSNTYSTVGRHTPCRQSSICILCFSCIVFRHDGDRRGRSRKAQQQELVLDSSRVKRIRCHVISTKTPRRRGDDIEASGFSSYRKSLSRITSDLLW